MIHDLLRVQLSTGDDLKNKHPFTKTVQVDEGAIIHLFLHQQMAIGCEESHLCGKIVLNIQV